MFFDFRKRSRITRRDSREDTGHSSAWKTNGMERTLTNHKGSGNFTADVMLENFNETGHPTFQGISALNRGVLKRKGGRCTILFTADSFECRALISHVSLSVYGAEWQFVKQDLKNLKIGSSSCLCSTTSIGCFSNSELVRDYAKRFPLGHWCFLSPGEKEQWYGTHNYKPEGTVEFYCKCYSRQFIFIESGHPELRGTSALDRGFLKRKGGRCTIRFSAESLKAELSFRTVNSANQPSTYGAMEVWCDELIDSADSWSSIFQHGEIHRESE